MSSTTDLEREVAELREKVNAPMPAELLAEKERQLAEAKRIAAEALEAGKARMLAIKRSYGSLAASYGNGDAERVRAATRELNEAIATMNARYATLIELEQEARGLNKTFGLPLPEFTNLNGTARAMPPVETVGTLETTQLLDHRNIVRIARAAAVGRAKEEAAAMSGATVEPQAPTRPRPKQSEREQRAARAMAEETRDANRALRTIPGRV